MVIQTSPSSVHHPPLYVSLSLRRLHPWAWLLCPFIRTECWCQHSFSPLLLLSHPPPPLPLSVASSKDALSISGTPWVKLVEEQGRGKDKELGSGGNGEKKKRGKNLTWRQKDNFGQAALFKVKAWFAFQKRRPAVLLPQGRHRDQPACHLMSACTRALMKLIEQPVIDNATAACPSSKPRCPPQHFQSSHKSQCFTECSWPLSFCSRWTRKEKMSSFVFTNRYYWWLTNEKPCEFSRVNWSISGCLSTLNVATVTEDKASE